MTTLSVSEQDALFDFFAKPSTKDERKRQLLHQIKSLHAELLSLEHELARADLGLPEPYKLDREWVPPFLRKQDEARGDEHQD